MGRQGLRRKNTTSTDIAVPDRQRWRLFSLNPASAVATSADLADSDGRAYLCCGTGQKTKGISHLICTYHEDNS